MRLFVSLLLIAVVAAAQTPKPLYIYVVDVEGGNAPVHNGAAFWFKISAQQDGSFTVTNTRNGYSKKYATKN